MLVGIVVAIGFLALSLGGKPAFACNRTAGCVMDSLQEDYGMMHDGRMEKAMKAGRDNVEAFRRLQEKQKAYSASK
ncbi:MAG TPA: hypothetical protein VIU82_12670 [Bosea sp. (in: a-proteobacteria)]